MDFSTHSWHRPKDSSPDCTELLEVVSKGTKDKGTVQEEGWLSVCVSVCHASSWGLRLLWCHCSISAEL